MNAQTLLRGLIVAAFAMGGLVAALVGGPAAGPVVAVFPPAWDGVRALNAAATGGSVLRQGAMAFVVVVLPDEPSGRMALWRAGAWLVFPSQLAAGCAPANKDLTS